MLKQGKNIYQSLFKHEENTLWPWSLKCKKTLYGSDRWTLWTGLGVAPDSLLEACPNRHIWQLAQGHSLTSPNHRKTGPKKYLVFGGLSVALAVWGASSHENGWPLCGWLLPRRSNQEAEHVHSPDWFFWECSSHGPSVAHGFKRIWISRNILIELLDSKTILEFLGD